MKVLLTLFTLLLLTACGGSGESEQESTSLDQNPSQDPPGCSDCDGNPPGNEPTIMSTAHTITADLANNSAIPRQTVSSYMDSSSNVHIAWIEDTQTGDQIHYGKYSSEGEFTSFSPTHPQFDLIWSVNLLIDDGGFAHIVFQGKRDNDVSCCKSGNYAIQYLTNESGSFATRQVSSNPLSATSTDKGLYDSPNNGRPDIFLNEYNQVTIIYAADDNSENSYDNYAVLANMSNGGTNRTRPINIEDLTGTYNLDHEFFVSRKSSSNGPFIWMDISDYNVHLVTSNSQQSIVGLGGYTDINDVQSLNDAEGQTYVVWLRDRDDETLGDDYAFYVYESGLSSPTRIPIQSTTVTSNFSPAAIDPETGLFYLLYSEGAFGTVYDQHIVIYDPINHRYSEVTLPEDLGVPYGHDSLWVNNGLISFVTSSSWTDIKINQWQLNQDSIIWTSLL